MILERTAFSCEEIVVTVDLVKMGAFRIPCVCARPEYPSFSDQFFTVEIDFLADNSF